MLILKHGFLGAVGLSWIELLRVVHSVLSVHSHLGALLRSTMLRAGVLALAITASSLDEFDAEAWKAQKDEELKFLLKVRELAHEHARAAAGSRFDDDRWGGDGRWARRRTITARRTSPGSWLRDVGRRGRANVHRRRGDRAGGGGLRHTLARIISARRGTKSSASSSAARVSRRRGSVLAQLERRRATASVDQLRELDNAARRDQGLLERGEDRWETSRRSSAIRNGRRGEDSVNVNERACRFWRPRTVAHEGTHF